MIPIRDRNEVGATGGLVTRLIVAVTVASYLVQGMLPEQQRYHIATQFGVVPALWNAPLAGDLGSDLMVMFTAASSLVVHGGFFHLAINMLYLWVFGDNVEGVVGGGRFIGLYIGAGLCGALAHAFALPASAIPAIGASGAVSGVVGAYAVLFPGARVLTIVPAAAVVGIADLPAILFVLIWITIQLLPAVIRFTEPLVSWWAHLGGFVAGAGFGAVWRWRV